ncbi:MAG TPA: NrfD/PsrC family molybdoenzyme membrane anchor subunit [Thermoanaerobaculia bacterium]|nr:NrfD/PsrC family molybdoenzyme membrane anchor subunit [Thermoanaerobaculia bacterium]
MTGRVPDESSERRLHELRREAERTGRVAGDGIRPVGAPFPAATPENGYYGLPLLKTPTWTWEVPLYFFVGGAAGAAATIASAAAMTRGPRRVVREGRRVALAGALISLPLLISDLGRPARFLNMLRVFKRQSPMSVGVWTLVAFSTSATAAVFFDELLDRGRGGAPVRAIGTLSGLVAGAAGAMMSVYTGVLLGATVVPIWSRNIAILPVHFAASSLGAASSILEMRVGRNRALARLATIAALIEMGLALMPLITKGKEPRRVRAAARSDKASMMLFAAEVLAGPVALSLRSAGSSRARRLAGLCAVAGSLLTRFGWVEAGRQSVSEPGAGL